MFNLKGIFFYFLAIRIILNKFIKKIYYSSNFYNNSLKTITPIQFYFFPNSFLLSSFINYKNFSFKISKVNLDDFWKNNYSKKENSNLNNFLWLNLIDRKNDGLVIQKIISIWIQQNKKYKNINWESETISKRVIAWMLNADIILNNAEKEFKIHFLQSLIIQINHLKKIVNFENNYLIKMEIVSAIILSGLIFKEYKKNFDFGIKELKKIVEEFFDNEGCPKSRNINDLIQSSKFLILIKECCKDAQEYIPDYIDDVVEKIIENLMSIKTFENKNPLFNGANENKMEDYFNYLSGLGYKSNKKKYSVSQIQILRNKKAIIFFDTGNPPKRKFSSSYQSGPLSFEYLNDGEKIITNCGYGDQISKKIETISRLTSAQSTLCINDTSVVNFEKNLIIKDAFGNSIKTSFKTFDVNKHNDDNYLSISGSHNAYESKFGYIHNRLIKINKKNNDLSGEDSLIKTKNTINQNKFNIRFHLYPEVTAVQTIGGNTILIQTQKNISLIFSTNVEDLMLEKSIFLARNQIINNFCINISGKINNENKIIKWEIKKVVN